MKSLRNHVCDDTAHPVSDTGTGDNTMMKEPDSMMVHTGQMLDDRPIMEGWDSMVADTGQMMESGSGKKMKQVFRKVRMENGRCIERFLFTCRLL